ncbi:MAG: hypothetical protein NXH75_18025, partial [Halobacteriovoraceae bacterium]|nr:hypothetical protein [Halobacteriovoraceae bacterium]
RVVPHISTFLQVCAAVAMGTGVTVLCRNKASYQWWQEALMLFQQSGFSLENINVYFPSDSSYEEVLHRDVVSYFILDGSEEWTKSGLAFIYGNERKERRIRNIFTPFDTFNPTDFKRLCGNYIWVRAFAVNTMRHGAPLDLDLDVEL